MGKNGEKFGKKSNKSRNYFKKTYILKFPPPSKKIRQKLDKN